MCIQANHYLSADMDAAMKHAADTRRLMNSGKASAAGQFTKIADEEDDSDLSGHRNGVIFLESDRIIHFECTSDRNAVNEESVGISDSCANPLSADRSFVKIQR